MGARASCRTGALRGLRPLRGVYTASLGAPDGRDGETSVAGDGGVDEARPGFDASGEGLGLIEALSAQPHGDR
jgi:hypothetical protein